MFDVLFSFIDPIIEPIIKLSEGDTCCLLQAETLSDFTEKKSSFDKMVSLPEVAKIVVPSHIVMSLLRADEVEKLKSYIKSYLAKHSNGEIM